MVVTIIGIGLIGGSLAISLRESGFATRLVGVEMSATHAARAVELGLVDEILSLEKAVAVSDVIIVATPVNSLATLLPQIMDLVDNQIVMDVGSTKSNILLSIADHPKRANFIAAHPMAGTEFSGPDAAVAKLFEGKACVLCDVEKSSDVAHRRAVVHPPLAHLSCVPVQLSSCRLPPPLLKPQPPLRKQENNHAATSTQEVS